MEARLLIVDGDSAVRNMIKDHARSEGFSFDETPDGISALKLFRRNIYGLIITDTELPELDGISVCRQIRKVSDIPVILLSAQGAEQDRLDGFRAGADDFVLKPFYPSELMARVRALLRRCGCDRESSPKRLAYGGLCIDAVSRTVFVDEHPVQLTPKEYDLLLYLAKNPDRAFSREALLDEVWGSDFYGTDRTVDTHIKTLRENLKPYHQFICTVWGYGYKFTVAQQE